MNIHSKPNLKSKANKKAQTSTIKFVDCPALLHIPIVL